MSNYFGSDINMYKKFNSILKKYMQNMLYSKFNNSLFKKIFTSGAKYFDVYCYYKGISNTIVVL